MEPVLLLLVEDDGLVSMAFEEALRDGGYEVVLARSGESALAELDADAKRFSGMITDIRVGEGPSGWEIARHARELAPALPVVYVSGDSAKDWAANGVPNSIMLSKPFAVDQLLTAVSTLINQTNSTLPKEPMS